jgi:hypothetical protein
MVRWIKLNQTELACIKCELITTPELATPGPIVGFI